MVHRTMGRVLALLLWSSVAVAQPTYVPRHPPQETLEFACNDTAAATEYLFAWGPSNSNCVATDAATAGHTRRLLWQGTLRQLVCRAGVGPDAGDTWTQRLRVNGVTTTTGQCMLVQATNPTLCTGALVAIAVQANDEVSVEHIDSDAAFDGTTLKCAVLLEYAP